MLNSSERSNSVSWSPCSALRARSENAKSLMTMIFSLPDTRGGQCIAPMSGVSGLFIIDIMMILNDMLSVELILNKLQVMQKANQTLVGPGCLHGFRITSEQDSAP